MKIKKKSSENDWSVSELFYFYFFVPPTLNLKKNSRKSTNKKILALVSILQVLRFEFNSKVQDLGNFELLHPCLLYIARTCVVGAQNKVSMRWFFEHPKHIFK